MTEKIKSLAQSSRGKDILSFIVILIIASGSFYLGQNSTTQNTTSQVQVFGAKSTSNTKPLNKSLSSTDTQALNDKSNFATTEPVVDEGVYLKGNYLASSRGKKYYPVDCPSAANIKASNRVYFKTASEAEQKGYTLSTSCN